MNYQRGHIFITTSEEIAKLPVISKQRSDECYKFFLEQQAQEKKEKMQRKRQISRRLAQEYEMRENTIESNKVPCTLE